MRTIATSCALLIGLASADVAAQTPSRLYVGPVAGVYTMDADHVTGSLTSAGLTAGVRVLPWMDVEVDLLKPAGRLTSEHTGPSISFGGPDAFVITRFTRQREVDFVVAGGVAFHPARPVRRLTPRAVIGISNHRLQDRTRLEHLHLPPGVTLEQVTRALPPGDWMTRNIGGPTVGGSLAVELGPHLWIVPDIRYDYGSLGDEINNMLRSSVRVLWSF